MDGRKEGNQQRNYRGKQRGSGRERTWAEGMKEKKKRKEGR